jgi:hypothetical protein
VPSRDRRRTVNRRRWISLGSGRTAIPHPGRTQPKLESTRSGEPIPRTASDGTWTWLPTRRPVRGRLVCQGIRRTRPGPNRSPDMTRIRLRARRQPELAPRRRSPRTMEQLPITKSTPKAWSRDGRIRQSAPGMLRRARMSVPPANRRRRSLRAKAPVPRSDGSRPTRPRPRRRSPSNSAPTGQSRRHPPVRGPRPLRRHRTPPPGPRQSLASTAPSVPSSRGDLVGRAGLSLPKVGRAASRLARVRTTSMVSGQSAAPS